jgi:hypothetical protein
VTNNSGAIIRGTDADSFGIGNSSVLPISVFNSRLITGVYVSYAANIGVLLSDRAFIDAYYDGELARINYQSNSLSAGVRMTFLAGGEELK